MAIGKLIATSRHAAWNTKRQADSAGAAAGRRPVRVSWLDVPRSTTRQARPRLFGRVMLWVLILATCSSVAADTPQDADVASEPRLDTAQMLTEYFERMSRAKPFEVRSGEPWKAHRQELQAFIMECVGLRPLPERVPLDVHQSETLDHPWCTVRRVSYQLWPGVYSSGLLFLPKQLVEQPAPAMLCPHGHWPDGHAHPDVQKRCLNFARLGYVTFSPTQHHYEDLYVGVSHQTLMIWNNMRALDYLESLPGVDKTRIGAAGASGGGLQTQMLTALDTRVKAATICGLTCDFREIMFPDATHCACNHFPNVMRRTDLPEISTLGLPAAVQYLTMNDWTRKFQADNFPTIRELYAANGCRERVFCKYFDTGHDYDRTKREWTYWWMERWLRGRPAKQPESEPETQTFPIKSLQQLAANVEADKGFPEIGRIYRKTRGFTVPRLATVDRRRDYRRHMTDVLGQLLGEEAVLPREAARFAGTARVENGLSVERVAYPSEGPVVVPTIVLAPATRSGRLPVTILLAADGKEALLTQTGPASPRALARAPALVALPDVRPGGELFSTGGRSADQQRTAWQRNGIVWGRPTPGMAVTDLRAVLDGLASRPDADMTRVTVVVRGSGELSIAALFAMVLDPRIGAGDLDFAGACFENRRLPLVPCILQHGDVLQWAALVTDRRLTLRNIPPEAGEQKRGVVPLYGQER